MDLEYLKAFFGLCALINFGLLVLWWLIFVFARGWVYRLHTRWWPMGEERFNAIHYRSLAGFKLAVFLFNLTPWLALVILG